ncbi:MAG: phosphoadenosine phosphosulfate reductase [Thermoprotei archaeon]|nr:MAG: phosphoadenosine phosphosulfate reductase [Thermoprotei archaeon]
MKITKIKAPLLFWDIEHNVPLLERPEEGEYIVVKATPPRDVRPLMGLDVEITINAIISELKDNNVVKVLLPPNEVALLNKVPYVDAGDEIIVEGRIVGHRFYDPIRREWRFKPLYEGVARMVNDEIGSFAIVNLPKLTRGFTVHRGDIIKAHFEYEKGRFVAVSTKNGKYHAVAKIVRGRRLHVIKAWKARDPRYINKSSSINDVIKANEHRLNVLVSKAKLIIRDALERHNAVPVISFSGGKDSLVVLDIACKELGIDNVIFNDTGLELPETIRAVEQAADHYGVDILIASANDSFFKALPIMGPPARDYRWCCKICKLRPIAKLYRTTFRGQVMSIVGQRKLESFARAFAPIVSRSLWIPENIVVAPINEWTALDVWLYIFRKKLRPNVLYMKGLDRIGCWLCPACELAEYEIVKKLHPDLWNSWESYLRKWAKKHGIPQAWVDYGGWRWLSIPGDFKRLMEQLKVNVKSFDIPRYDLNLHPLEVKENKIQLIINNFDPKRFLRFVPILSKNFKSMNNSIVVFINDLKLEVSKDIITISSLRGSIPQEDLYIILSVILRSHLCVACGLCELWCPNSAITLKGNMPYVDMDKCTSCQICNERCFISQKISVEVMKRYFNETSGDKREEKTS